jgi:hypothetical protein
VQIFISSDNQASILRDIKGYNAKRLEHLLKLFYYREDTKDFNGWIGSVASSPSFIESRSRVKAYPKKELIFRATWVVMEDTFLNKEELFRENFEEDITDYALPSQSLNSRDFCAEYHAWFSEKLSLVGKTPRQEVAVRVKELLIKYPI